MGITPEHYNAKLRECIDCTTDEDKKLAKTLILAGADMVIEPKGKEGVKAFGEKVRAAMKHADVMKLGRIAVAEKMKNIENMHNPERGDLLLQYNIVEWTPTRYEEKLNAAAAAAKAYGQSIKDAQNKPEGDAAHDEVKNNGKNHTITASLLPKGHEVLQRACGKCADLLKEGEASRNRILQVFEKLERHSGNVDLKAKDLRNSCG